MSSFLRYFCFLPCVLFGVLQLLPVSAAGQAANNPLNDLGTEGTFGTNNEGNLAYESTSDIVSFCQGSEDPLCQNINSLNGNEFRRFDPNTVQALANRDVLTGDAMNAQLTLQALSPLSAAAQQAVLQNVTSALSNTSIAISNQVEHLRATKGEEAVNDYLSQIGNCVDSALDTDPTINVEVARARCIQPDAPTTGSGADSTESVSLRRLPSGQMASGGCLCVSNQMRDNVNVMRDRYSVDNSQLDAMIDQLKTTIDRMLMFVGDVCSCEVAGQEDKYTYQLVAPSVKPDENGGGVLGRYLTEVAYKDMLAIFLTRCKCENDPVNVPNHSVFGPNSARCVDNSAAQGSDAVAIQQQLKVGAYGTADSLARLKRLSIQGVGNFSEVAECLYDSFSKDPTARSGGGSMSSAVSRFLPSFTGKIHGNGPKVPATVPGGGGTMGGAVRMPSTPGGSGTPAGSGSSMNCGIFEENGPMAWDKVTADGARGSSSRVNELIALAKPIAWSNANGLQTSVLGTMNRIGSFQATIVDEVKKLFEQRIGLVDYQGADFVAKLKKSFHNIQIKCADVNGREPNS